MAISTVNLSKTKLQVFNKIILRGVTFQNMSLNKCCLETYRNSQFFPLPHLKRRQIKRLKSRVYDFAEIKAYCHVISKRQ